MLFDFFDVYFTKVSNDLAQSQKEKKNPVFIELINVTDLVNISTSESFPTHSTQHAMMQQIKKPIPGILLNSWKQDFFFPNNCYIFKILPVSSYLVFFGYIYLQTFFILVNWYVQYKLKASLSPPPMFVLQVQHYLTGPLSFHLYISKIYFGPKWNCLTSL